MIEAPEGVAAPEQTEAPAERRALTVSQILAAPPDCREEWLEVPEWGGWVKLRSPTALAAADIKGASIVMGGEDEKPTMDLAAMERAQVRHGVVDPIMSDAEVRQMQERFGPSFQRVIAALDTLSGPLKEKDGEEKLRSAAERTFRAGGN